MTIWSSISRFVDDDQAAITVDWVVLTAGLVFLGLAVVTVVSASLDSNAVVIADGITDAVSSALS